MVRVVGGGGGIVTCSDRVEGEGADWRKGIVGPGDGATS